VRSVLLRPLYRGEIVWNQTRKRDTWGQSNRSDRAAADWLRIPAPNLRIVSDDLWREAHRRFAERQRKHTTTGRNHQDLDSRYLLSGFARCGHCGGGFAAHSRNHGGRRAMFYGCTSFWKRGSKVCTNNLVARMDVIEAEVLATIDDDVCRPAVIQEAVRLALSEFVPARMDDRRQRLESERDTARQECERLADAIACGGPIAALVKRLQSAQERATRAEDQLRGLGAQGLAGVNLADLEGRIRAKLADWRGLLRRNVTEGRAVLSALLVGPLRFMPVKDERRRGYAFEGTIALDRLLSGVVVLPTVVASHSVPSWNQILTWLQGLSELRESGILAA
jgi:Recombinase zinc beta ribbon domain/Recombinase